MTADRRRHVPDLRGDALFAALVEAGDCDALELLWRANQPELAQRIARYLAAVREPALTGLLLSELAAPEMPIASVRPDILTAIESHLPPLSEAGVRVLDEALRDSEVSPLVPSPADHEPMERWLFAQPGASRDEYALFIIENQVALTPAPTTLTLSLGRCAENADVRARAAEIYRARLAESQDAASWTAAAAFIEAICAPGAKQPEVLALVSELVEFAPSLLGTGLPPTLAALIRTHGYETLKELLSAPTPVAASAGMTALLEIADHFPRQAQRLAIVMLAYTRHPALWPTLELLVKAWEDERWDPLLDRILTSSEGDLPAALAPLLSHAPIAFSALLVQIAGTHRSDDPELLEAVGSKAFDAFMLAQSEDRNRAGVVWWPDEGDEQGRAFLRELVGTFGMEETQVGLLAYGLSEGAASPALVAGLVPDGEVRAFLEYLSNVSLATGPYRAILEALRDARPEELNDAARHLQASSFSLDLAAVLASSEPDVAFTAGEAAYDGMGSAGQDELIDLLDKHATTTQLPLVELFARASERSERSRRSTAFRLVARLAPEGTVPDYLMDGLRVPDPTVSDAAFAAIATLRPRNIAVLRELRSIAKTDGKIARLAAGALDDLAAGYTAELEERLTTAKRIEILALLGAAARPQSMVVLLAHLGDAESDDPAVHRAAAEAVLEATPFVSVTTAQIEQIGELLDGEVQENDPAARQSLGDAMSLASLGPDDALALLYELTKYRPKSRPDDLFGIEKGTLLRQLGLYKRESDRGRVGRATALAHLDNVAERIVRAAYLRLGSSEPMKVRIAESPRDPDYGALLRALGGDLDKARNGFGRLHEIRSEETEVPHPGKPTSDGSWSAALDGFAHAGNVCLVALDDAIAAQS